MFEEQYNRRVIIIDDNEEVHRDFESLLVAAAPPRHLDELEAAVFGATPTGALDSVSYELGHALQGEEGVEKTRQAVKEGLPYALAFVDMRMPPGWDGIETIRRIWKVDPAMQIVICTAYSDYDLSGLRSHLRRTDSLLILKKPFDPEEVQQLASALTRKWVLTRQAEMKMEELERLVEERTATLAGVNQRLAAEIMQRTASEEALRRLSVVDGLTGVPNRRVFDEMLVAQWARAAQNGSSIALLMIDLDLFKQYNDLNGHLAGDDCLKRVAKALIESTDRRRDLLARYGGEEFAAILTETDLHGAMIVGERMRSTIRALNLSHKASSVAQQVTVSIGCAALTPSEEMNPAILIAAADHALYHAKERGRNRVMSTEHLE